jgi:hypothetical protein
MLKKERRNAGCYIGRSSALAKHAESMERGLPKKVDLLSVSNMKEKTLWNLNLGTRKHTFKTLSLFAAKTQ